jgi:ATP-dependent helicase HrpB
MEEPWLEGKKILMLEPRRLAARMVAERMAFTLGEAPGERIGYRMRGEIRCGPGTRIEVVTEGLLTRMLRRDPSLEEVGLLIFDEFHERSLQSDTGLALALQSQELLREDLRILIMSATLESGPLEKILGPGTPRIESGGRKHPVTIRHLSPNTPFPSPHELPVRMAEKILEALKEESEGSLLAFLPGAAEIRRCETLLRTRLGREFLLAPLYGTLKPQEQRRAVAPPPPGKRKVVLATNIAETSLTLEDVRIVVDGGYERRVRYDAGRGMDRMETLPISAASATQRAGRAGRTAPGVCHRLWPAERSLSPRAPAEILRADLAPLVLELAAWGADASELSWIDPPPTHALESAEELLKRLGMLDHSGRITPLGERALDLGEHPRIAQMLLRAEELGLGREAALLAAILSERPVLESGDLSEGAEEIRRRLKRGDPSLRRLERTQKRLRKLLKSEKEEEDFDAESVGLLIALAYPERVALRRGKEERYRSAGGRGMRLREGDPLGRFRLLAVAESGGEGNESTIFSAAPLQPKRLEEAGLARWEEALRFDEKSGRVEARRILRCGALILESAPLPLPNSGRVAPILLEGIRKLGAASLPWTPGSRKLRERVLCARRHLGDTWPDWSDEKLMEEAEHWLLPWMERMRSVEELERLDLRRVLESALGWERLRELDALLPERIPLPAGSDGLIDYGDPEAPRLSARLQELFGWRESPRILGGKLPLTVQLLSPARRPLALTRDLENFWRNVYPEVRKEMRGRYPKHYWPEDPFAATATTKTKKGMER